MEVYGYGSDTTPYTLNWNINATSSKPSFVHSQFRLDDGNMAYVVGTKDLTAYSFDAYDRYYESNGATVIDAEKSSATDADDNLCWAGTLSNMLAWTGWGQKGLGFANHDKAEDTIFQEFIDNFEDGGSNFEKGINWFFSGDYGFSGLAGWAKPTGPGNYLGMSASRFTDELYALDGNYDRIITAKEMSALGDYLEHGAGVYVSVGWYEEDGADIRYGGHAITCWGYTYDPEQVKGSEQYYTGLIVSDSDDMKYYSNPLETPDTLKIMNLTWSDLWGCYYIDNDDYPTYLEGKVESFGVLLPENMDGYAIGVNGSDDRPYVPGEINGGDIA